MSSSAIQTLDLEKTAEQFGKMLKQTDKRVIVCAGTGCIANGSLKVYDAFLKEIEQEGLKVVVQLKEEEEQEGTYVSKSGCQGFCQMGPLVWVEPAGVLYVKVTPTDVPDIVGATLKHGVVLEHLLYTEPASGARAKNAEEIHFYQRQSRTVLKECGHIDPEDIREYISHGGYFAARRVFTEMTPEAVCEEMLHSGLRGRGGGGFPTGKKWDLTRIEPEGKKYVICNGDEGDPGAFMDRSVMEGNPHSVLEGMMIAARAIGADEGYLYVRAEYPLAVKRLRRAVADAENAGILGDDVFGSGLSLHLHVMEGAGAFVCGEETALIASIEGDRGMPAPKPPYPAQKGLWGKPTVINNVETLASVPLIYRMGAAKFRSIGTEGSPGTKTFALTGHVANTGLIEVPFGASLREIVYNIGGGVTDNQGNITGDGFKAVQIGGPSGGCLTEEFLDLPLDYDSIKTAGAMVGSGGLVVMNKQTCIVRIARFFMQFTQNESCGKCVLCREGTKQLLALLDDIIEGRADEGTLELLETLARTVQKGSLCGLGKTAPNPVLSTLRYFRPEYEAHVFQKRCPTGECKALTPPKIDPEKCRGCGLCTRACPVEAISGEKKQAHHIDPELCIKCRACVSTCKFGAID